MIQDFRIQLDRLRARQGLLSGGGDAAHDGKLLNFFVKAITGFTDAERGSIFIHDPSNQQLWLKAGTGVPEKGIQVSVDGSIVGRVIATGEPIRVDNLEGAAGAHKVIDAGTGFVTRNVLCVPVRSPSRNEVIGAIQALNKRSGQGFDDVDRATMEEVADAVRLSVEQAFLGQEMGSLIERLLKFASNIFTALLAVSGGAVVLALLVMGMMAVASKV